MQSSIDGGIAVCLPDGSPCRKPRPGASSGYCIVIPGHAIAMGLFLAPGAIDVVTSGVGWERQRFGRSEGVV